MKLLLKLCLEQITKGECLGSSFTKVGRKGIQSKFTQLTGRTYNKAQLKNKYDNLRKDWCVWYKLFGKETENPLYGKFRYKRLPIAHQLTILFKDVVTTRDFMWAPSSGILPSTLGGDVNDVYRPCLDGININMGEGSRDSDDVSVGVTNEFGDININASQVTGSQAIGSQKSGEKRK
ncbi:hypothetical protein AAZX31_14G205700 [Glycine max]